MGFIGFKGVCRGCKGFRGGGFRGVYRVCRVYRFIGLGSLFGGRIEGET